MKTLANAPTLKTKLHTYEFDLSTPEGRLAYRELHDELHRRGYTCMKVISAYRNRPDNGEVLLDCSYVYNNQWNTSEDSPTNRAARVFDWIESYTPERPDFVWGHYLDGTPEMKKVRETTYKCGFCGAHYHESETGSGFCTSCLDSPYLAEENLPLIRLTPVSDSVIPPLSDEEKEKLLPMYREAQARLRKQKAEAKRREVQEKFKKAPEEARIECEGMLWLLDHEINMENVIFYPHTGKFCFGWRHPLPASVREELEEHLKGFPFEFEFK